MSEERKGYNTTLRVDLTRKLRIIAAHTGKRQNELLEEAIQELAAKYRLDDLPLLSQAFKDDEDGE